MKIVDLHAHSTASDGTLSPAELVRYGAEKGLAALALTDHDTVDGLADAVAAGEGLPLEVIPGIEMTTVVDGCDVHIVGLYIDPSHPVMREQLVQMAESRRQRNYDVVSQLEAAGVDIHLSDMAAFEGRAITKGHIASVLIRRGYAENLKDAIARYMEKGTVGYVMRKTPPPEVCIRTIQEAGGLAFVAHTNQIDRKDPAHGIAVCRQVLEAGADGLETLYCEFDAFWEKTTEALAAEYGLLRSGGSDFHGAIKEGLDLAVGYGNLAVPAAFVDAMKEKLTRRGAQVSLS